MSLAVDATDLYRLSPDEYHQLVESGGFDEKSHVELIHGLLCDMSPRTPAHEHVVTYLTRVLALALDHERYTLRPGCALSIGDSEPEPDFAIVKHGTNEPYHPASAELAIEIAVSSQRRDLVVKPPIYAAAGVREYWVIDVGRGRAVVHRDPAADGYRSRIAVDAGGELDAGVVGIGRIPLEDVLTAAGSS